MLNSHLDIEKKTNVIIDYTSCFIVQCEENQATDFI